MKHSTLRFRTAAFSLIELMVACGMLAIASAAAIAGLIRMNQNAMLSRLQTGASTLAQDRIDHILQDAPFNPALGQIPATLQTGTQAFGSSSNPTLAIYTDPETGKTVVPGWMTSSVTQSQITVGPTVINVYHATVTVSYTFRGRPYSVTMSTVRSPDA